MVCSWDRRLQTLPDPVHDGQQTAGIAGQVFLVATDGRAAPAAGDLTVAVYDETPRPPGVAGRPREVFHFDQATFARFRTADARFGPCYAMFLPWPAEWQDVTTVRLTARYQTAKEATAGSPDLYAPEVKLALDPSAPGTPVWTDASGKPAGGFVPQPADTRGVPDARKALAAMQAGAGSPRLTGMGSPPPVQQAQAVRPADPPPGMAAAYGGANAPATTKNGITTKAWAGPPPAVGPAVVPIGPPVAGGFEPIIVPPRGS